MAKLARNRSLMLAVVGLLALHCGIAQRVLTGDQPSQVLPPRAQPCESARKSLLALPSSDRTASALYQLAVCFAGGSAWGEAQKTLDVLFQSFPRYQPAVFLQSHILFQTGQYQDSIQHITRYLEHDPRNGEARKILGLSYYMTEHSEEAESQLLLVTEVNPSDPQAWYYLGRLRFTRQNLVEALANFQKALALDPKNAKYHNHLGQALEGLGRFEAARSAYLKAIDLQVSTSTGAEWPFYNLGLLCLKEGRAAEAVRLFEQAEAKKPEWADAKVQLVVAYLNLDQAEAAKSYAQLALQIDPKNPKAHYQMARVLKRLGRRQEATEHFLQFEKLQSP